MERPKENMIFPISIGKLMNDAGINGSFHGVDPETEVDMINCRSFFNNNDRSLYILIDDNKSRALKAHEDGASVILTDWEIDEVPFVLVDDIGDALKRIGLWMYSIINKPCVAVTGSVGKTTTKRMIADVLKTEKKTFCNYDTYNVTYEVCCIIQHINKDDEIVVQEIDESWKNNTVDCSEILHPHIAVVTNIAESHIGKCGGKSSLINAVYGITSGVDQDGILVINGDDENCMGIDYAGKTITFGINNKEADYVASNIVTKPNGKTEFDIIFDEKKTHLKLSVPGEHNVYDAMIAFIVGKIEGIGVKNIQKALMSYRNTGIRQNICKLGNQTVYADCYNASPTSIKYALKSFAGIGTKRSKKVAILGDISEVEGYEREIYGLIAKCVDESDIDAIITYGKDSKMILEMMSKDITKKHISNYDEMNNCIKEMKKEGYNCWLFKASRGMQLEDNICYSFRTIYRLIRVKEKLYSLLTNREFIL